MSEKQVLTADQRRRIRRRLDAVKKQQERRAKANSKVAQRSASQTIDDMVGNHKSRNSGRTRTNSSAQSRRKSAPNSRRKVVGTTSRTKGNARKTANVRKNVASQQHSGGKINSAQAQKLRKSLKTSSPKKSNTKRNNNRQQREIVTIPESHKKPVTTVPKIPKDTLRIIPIGGNEEVGRNMDLFEYGDDIVLVDMGMQFPEEDMPGIDYIVPNVSYLKGKEKKIRAVIFTHGHLDHIGAAPILLEQLGYPPIIARDLTLALIKKKIMDYDPGALKRLKEISIKDVTKPVRLGSFVARFFEVEHSIMDSMGVALETPVGTPIHMGDWTINHDPVDGKKITYEHLAQLPSPKILMLESLGSTKTETKSEKVVQGNLETLIKNAPGRLIIGTFASQIKRISHLLQFAQKLGKKVALDGYSMRTNMEIAQELGYLNVRKDLIIPIEEVSKYPDNKIIILCTGAQGESNASLNRIVTDNHRVIKIQKSDTIVFSSSVIPGNERSVQRLKDNLYRKCSNVVHSEIMDIHMGGHSSAGDIRDVVKMIKPDYFLPIYANHFMLHEAAKRAVEAGFNEKKVVILDNGQVVDFGHFGPKILKERADVSYVFVDGLGVGDIGHVVLRDRNMLSTDGMYAITVIVDHKTKKIVGNMQVTSRGFIYVKENFDLVNETKKIVKKVIQDNTSKDTRMDWKTVENAIRDALGEFLFQKTQRRPMVLPVIVEV